MNSFDLNVCPHHEQAFPSTVTNSTAESTTLPEGIVLAPGDSVTYFGMTLRDYFAGRALTLDGPIGGDSIEWRATIAYKMADAMLHARRAAP